jgi:hypothetical protein
VKLKSCCVCIALFLAGSLCRVYPQGTAFTYQGALLDSNNLANGSYDLSFLLSDASTNGDIVAGPITNFAVGVTNGVFSVALDFGGAFDGAMLWLDISVRTNGGAVFTELSPRQQLMPTPYAIFAEGANGAGISGSIPAASLSGSYSNIVSLINPGNSFAGNGGGLTNINATSLNGMISTPILQPLWDGSNMIADATRGSVEYFTQDNLAFSFATNGIAGTEVLCSIYLYGGVSNRTVTFPSNWVFFNCTATNTLLSNEWTAVHFRFRGATASLASQTNVMVKLEAQ